MTCYNMQGNTEAYAQWLDGKAGKATLLTRLWRLPQDVFNIVVSYMPKVVQVLHKPFAHFRLKTSRRDKHHQSYYVRH